MALINALELEDTASKTKMEEEQADYYGDLIAAVAGLADVRAAHALAGAIETGAMASRGLAVLGPVAIDPVVDRLDDAGELPRLLATRTLVRMLEVGSVTSRDSGSLNKVKVGLLRGATDSNYKARMVAIGGLSKLPGSDVTAVLRSIAARDTFAAPDRGGSVRFLVREAAKALIGRQ